MFGNVKSTLLLIYFLVRISHLKINPKFKSIQLMNKLQTKSIYAITKSNLTFWNCYDCSRFIFCRSIILRNYQLYLPDQNEEILQNKVKMNELAQRKSIVGTTKIVCFSICLTIVYADNFGIFSCLGRTLT